MDTHAHTNGRTKKRVSHASHTATPATKVVAKTARHAKHKATDIIHDVERKAAKIVEPRGGTFATFTRRGVTWVKENPKTAIGLLVGTGVLVGVMTRTRLGRTALLGLGGLATAAIRRFI